MKTRKVFVLFLLLLLPMSSVGQTAASGYAVTPFVTGFGTSSIGPIGLVFDTAGNLYVGDFADGFLYKFGPAGGIVSGATQLNATSLGAGIVGLAFTKDGRLYLAIQPLNVVVEIDPSNGNVIRTVASVSFASGLATDPLSGDLFVSQGSFGLSRISNFAGGPGTVTFYAPVPNVDGIAFGPDGTLYAAVFGAGEIAKVAGTNSSTPGAVTILPVSVPFVDGVAISADANTPFLYGNRNDGIITKIGLSTTPPTLTNVVSGGSRGDFVTVGPDGCLYATQSDRVLKVTNADGTCLPPPLGPLFPTSPTALPMFVDIKPQSCPNPINVGANGTLAVAILGTSTFDVTAVNPSSVKLQGVSPLRFALEDVATPFAGALVSTTSCTTAGPDGFTDLVLSFDKQAVSAALGPLTNGQGLVLTLTGNLLPSFGGTAISGQDVVVINK